jgi:hypothetical protein
MDQELNDGFDDAFTKTLTSENIEILKDFAEISIDSFLKDGLGRDLPIVKWIVGAANTVTTVRDYFLLKKVLLFLREADKTTPEQRKKFVQDINSNEAYSQKVGETLMIWLDRYDHIDKASILSKLFNGCVQEKITYYEFLRLASCIDRAFIHDLQALFIYFEAEEVNSYIKAVRNGAIQNLYSCDLSQMVVHAETKTQPLEDFDFAAETKIKQVYDFNENAFSLAWIVLGDKFHNDRQ